MVRKFGKCSSLSLPGALQTHISNCLPGSAWIHHKHPKLPKSRPHLPHTYQAPLVLPSFLCGGIYHTIPPITGVLKLRTLLGLLSFPHLSNLSLVPQLRFDN